MHTQQSSIITCTHTYTQINVVFDRIRETKNFNGTVLFLEEDHFVTPDFIVMTRKLEKLRDE